MSAVPGRKPLGDHRESRGGSSSAFAAHDARELAELAALVCEAPHSVLTLPGVGSVWSRTDSATDPELAAQLAVLEQHARLGSGIFEIQDATHDERFRAAASTKRPASIVFYAGTALCGADGRVLGTLSVVDAAPRCLTAAQRAALLAVAREILNRLAIADELVLARAMIESAPVAIYHADEGGDVTVANPEYRRLLQLGATDSLREWVKGVHADDRARVEAAWAEFCRQRQPMSFEYRGAERDGVSRVLAEQVNIAEGVPGFVGSITDVTERVATGERLQRIEALFRNTFEQAPMGIAYGDRTGRVLRCNPAYARMLGYSSAELVGMSLSELNHPEDAAHDAAELDRLWQGKIDAYSIEKRYQRKNGSSFWVRASAGLIRDSNGIPECSVCFDRDISHRKDIEAALAESRKVLEAIISDVPVAILACNMSGQMLVHNRAAAELFAIPTSDSATLTGPGAYAFGVDVLLPDGITPLAREDRPLARALRGEPITDMEMVVRGNGGPDRITVSSARQIFGQQGEVLGAVVVSQDITERKDAELELERVHKQLIDSSRVAGMAEVATNVLHNVGNVLNSVNVCVSRVGDHLRQTKSAGLGKVAVLLKEREGDLASFITTDERGRRLPAYLAQLAERLDTDQRLALTELASLQSHIEHIKETVMMQQSYAKLCGVTETVEVTALVDDCLRMNTGALARHGVQVRREIADVPPITVDKHKVLQIMVNLVRNAKYACDESGRPDRLVIVRVEAAGPMVRLSVIDNGIGIAADDMRRLFSHGFTTKKSGHGFGLHSAALAARDLGGTLTAQSEGRGCGAKFVLELPREAPHG
jgi:PAS domain S-box-containing protein